jgi:2-aminoethylphosphonate aminotransferase
MKDNWKQIWANKGTLPTNDLKLLDGYENTNINPKEVAKKIIKVLRIKKTDKILEIGCGAGLIAKYLNCDYIGIDYSKSLAKKHIDILHNSVIVAEADNLPFKDNYFDKCICFSVSHYFPNKEYTKKVIQEMKRVTKGEILMGDLPIKSKRKSHLLFKPEEFKGEISAGFYNLDRFNIILNNHLRKRNIILTPAPATTTDSVKQAQVVSDICPREKEFGELMTSIRKDLVKIVKGDDNYTSILFTGSGTSVMDSVINSVVPPRKKILIIENGAYGKRMKEIAKSYEIKYIEAYHNWGDKLNLERIDNYLKFFYDIDCVAVVHHETTTGILNNIEVIGKIVKKYNKTYIVDTISSYAGIPIDIKKIKADFIMASANKCLQGMPGISFVIAKKEALEKTKYFNRSYYLNLYKNYKYFEEKQQTPFTPAVQCIYALRQAIDEFFKEGTKRYKRYINNWKILIKGMEKLGFTKLLDDKDESHIVTTFNYLNHPKFNFEKMHDLLYKEGFTIYPGKITNKKTFRLGNIGAINEQDIKKFLVNLKIVLRRMGVK